jgi:hypothetical protein
MHIHIVNVDHDPDRGQSVGKAVGVDAVISQLEALGGRKDETEEAELGMADVTLTANLGEEHELWTDIFRDLKGKRP